MVQLGNDWDEILCEEFKKEYYLKIREFLKVEYKTRVIYPPMFDIFNALKFTSYQNTRVIILGQDPYHGEGQAHGLCFPSKKESKNHRLLKISSRSLMQNTDPPPRSAESLQVGRSKASCC